MVFLAGCGLSQAAVPTYQAFESTQFDTNALAIKYRSDWTNEVGVLRPTSANTEVTLTNLNLYETFVTPAKVYALSLGTNELNVATNTSWLLSSPTNDASQVILSLSAGKFQGQWLLITSQNDTGGFTLPDGSEQYDVPGALVDTQGDWVGTTNRGSILQYVAPDWIEMFRFNPELPAPEGFTIGAGLTNIAGVLSATGGGGDTIWTNVIGTIQPLDGQTTNRLQFISGAADNATNVALVVDTTDNWVADGSKLFEFKKAGTNAFYATRYGSLVLGKDTLNWVGFDPDNWPAITGMGDIADGVTTDYYEFLLGVQDSVGTFNSGYVNITGTTTNFTLNFHAGGDYPFQVTGDGTTGHGILTLRANATPAVVFNPGIASTGSAVAYLMDISNVMTNGDSLLQVKNAGVNRVRFQHDGTLSIQNTTNRLGVSAGVLQLDGVNIGGSSATIITTNNFEYNGNVTYKNAVYVTNTTIYINGVDVKTVSYGGACSDETTALVAGTGKLTFRMPHALTVTAVRASLTTAQTSGGLVTTDINEAGASILGTKITLDNGERTSTTAATPATITDSAIADDAEMTIDLDSLGDGTAKGLKIWITGIRLP